MYRMNLWQGGESGEGEEQVLNLSVGRMRGSQSRKR